VSTATGTRPTALAVNPAGTFVYVTNELSNSLATYRINQSSGTLSRVGGTVTGLSQPIAVGLTLAIE
jgi:6-phosphogluconolactonase (cycloisomerase 2 family)